MEWLMVNLHLAISRYKAYFIYNSGYRTASARVITPNGSSRQRDLRYLTYTLHM